MSLVFTQLASDNFHRANEEPLNPVNWSVTTPPFGELAVLSNVCVAGTVNVSNFAAENWIGTAIPANQYAELTINTIPPLDSNSGMSVYARNTSAVTGYQVSVSPTGDTTFTIRLFNVATEVDLGAPFILSTINSGDKIRLVCLGTTISAYYNQILVISGTDSEFSFGGVGLNIAFSSTQSDTSVSLFTAGSVSTQTGVLSISGNVYNPGVSITLSGAGTATTMSTADGSYSFTGLGAGSYIVTPTKSGLTFTPTAFGETVTAQNITNINFYPTPPSPINPYSVPDCRSSVNFPNGAIDVQLTETYVIQTSSNLQVPSFDSRLAGAPQDSRKFPNIPLNCRVGPSGQSAQDLLLLEDGSSYLELESGLGFISLEI